MLGKVKQEKVFSVFAEEKGNWQECGKRSV